nr:hypothetical protein BaRGS_028684 [Batillaria attramentaria]
MMEVAMVVEGAQAEDVAEVGEEEREVGETEEDSQRLLTQVDRPGEEEEVMEEEEEEEGWGTGSTVPTFLSQDEIVEEYGDIMSLPSIVEDDEASE